MVMIWIIRLLANTVNRPNHGRNKNVTVENDDILAAHRRDFGVVASSRKVERGALSPVRSRRGLPRVQLTR
jgi:hypothetical protein